MDSAVSPSLAESSMVLTLPLDASDMAVERPMTVAVVVAPIAAPAVAQVKAAGFRKKHASRSPSSSTMVKDVSFDGVEMQDRFCCG